MKRDWMLQAALASLVVGCTSTESENKSAKDPMDHAMKKGGKYKCYGIAKAGKNDCGAVDANGKEMHACSGMAKTDYDPKEWKYTKSKKECDMRKAKMGKKNKSKKRMKKKKPAQQES